MMISDYSSSSSDELIVGEGSLRKKSNDFDEINDNFEEEESKEKENNLEIGSTKQKDTIILKEKKQHIVNQQKVSSYSSYSDSEDEVYEVEEIVNHRKKNGKIQYFLKWVGYSSSENTWEFEESLNCPDLVKEYWKKKGNEKIKRNELKMFQKKELEIRKKKIIEKEQSQNNHLIDKKSKSKKALNQNIIKDPLAFRQMRFPLYDIMKPKCNIKSIIGYKIIDQKLSYHVLLDNDDITNLSSNEVQECNPNILLNYFEKKIISEIE